MLIITTQAGRKLVKHGGYMPILRVMCPALAGSHLSKEGPKVEENKASRKRHTTNIGMINNFFQVNY